MLALFALGRVMAVVSFGWRGLFQGVVIAAVIAFGLVQGVWGTWRRGVIRTEQARHTVIHSETRDGDAPAN